MVFANFLGRNKSCDVYQKLSVERQALLSKVEDKPLRQLLCSPLPDVDQLIEETDFFVFDFETTGLSCERDHILSMGWCNIKNGKVVLHDAAHFYVNQTLAVYSQSATINHITPETVKHGVALEEGIARLLSAMAGKVAVAHGTVIEKQFIDHYFMLSSLQSPLPILWLDTLLLEKSFPVIQQYDHQADYRLSTLRQQYELPIYANHNALIDAVATAELLLCQINRVKKLKRIATLGELLNLSMPNK